VRLVLATNNPGKVREIQAMLGARFEVVPQSSLAISEAEEPHHTFIENALAKARHASRAARLPALADDSGLCVDALNGAPGIYSARWAGPQRDFDFAMERLRLGLIEEGTLDTKAHFIAGLALAWPDGHIEYFEGRVDGTLVWPPRGEKGFGYDPMFVPQGHEETFGEMEPERKHGLSHRADAFRQLVDACFRQK
jgi:XTP/dITP diphosphohydrolase